jgi:hypothetical protein
VAETYFVNNLIRFSVEFKLLRVLTDPTTVSMLLIDPDGNTVSFSYPATITKDSTGKYHCDHTPTTPGTWKYRWVGTGTVPSSATRRIRVLAEL